MGSRNRNMERRRKNSRIFGSKSPLSLIIEKVTVSPQRVQKIPSRFGTSYYLSREDVEFLRKNTNYSAKDIKIWFRNFKKECPNGILDKGKVSKIYEQKLVPNEDSKFLVDQLFRIIDDDNNGGIDFK